MRHTAAEQMVRAAPATYRLIQDVLKDVRPADPDLIDREDQTIAGRLPVGRSIDARRRSDLSSDPAPSDVAAEMLPDQGLEDIDQGDPAKWLLFDRYPRITYGRDADWRRRALRAYGDLAAMIKNGQLLRPGCTAEEVALWFIIELAAAFEQDRDAWPTIWSELQELPPTADDFNWDELRDDLFEDHDFLMLYSPDLDGIEDPRDEVNALIRIGPYLRPQDWFTPFGESGN